MDECGILLLQTGHTTCTTTLLEATSNTFGDLLGCVEVVDCVCMYMCEYSFVLFGSAHTIKLMYTFCSQLIDQHIQNTTDVL